jgi:hypothetical protein
MRKGLFAVVFFGLLLIGYAETQVVTWTHVIQASEYSPATTEDGRDYLVYTYYDKRFNTNDWYDTWMEDWMEQTEGWSEFEPARDVDLQMFMYQAEYNKGFVTWKTYTADLQYIVGKKLKFYWMKAQR